MWMMNLLRFIVYCTPKALYNHLGGGGLSSTTTSGLWIFEKRRAISFYGFHLAGEIHIQYNEAFCVETMNSKFNRKLKLYS